MNRIVKDQDSKTINLTAFPSISLSDKTLNFLSPGFSEKKFSRNHAPFLSTPMSLSTRGAIFVVGLTGACKSPAFSLDF